MAGTEPGSFSQLDISGVGSFQGIIDLSFIDGFAPTTGESFDLINVRGGADLSNATFQIEGLEPGFQFSDTFAHGQFTLVAENNGVSTAPEPSTLTFVGAVLSVFWLVVQSKKMKSRQS